MSDLEARAFNAITAALPSDYYLPLSVRQAIATATAVLAERGTENTQLRAELASTQAERTNLVEQWASLLHERNEYREQLAERDATIARVRALLTPSPEGALYARLGADGPVEIIDAHRLRAALDQPGGD